MKKEIQKVQFEMELMDALRDAVDEVQVASHKLYVIQCKLNDRLEGFTRNNS